MSEIDKMLALSETLPDIKEAKEHPELITPEVVDTINQVGEGLSKFGQVLADWINVVMPPVMEKIIEIGGKLNDWVYQIYLDNGAIYGENREGSYRWFKNLVKENRKQQELEARGMGYGQEVPLDYLLYLNNKLKRRLN